jgi:hypothetical protein
LTIWYRKKGFSVTLIHWDRTTGCPALTKSLQNQHTSKIFEPWPFMQILFKYFYSNHQVKPFYSESIVSKLMAKKYKFTHQKHCLRKWQERQNGGQFTIFLA